MTPRASIDGQLVEAVGRGCANGREIACEDAIGRESQQECQVAVRGIGGVRIEREIAVSVDKNLPAGIDAELGPGIDGEPRDEIPAGHAVAAGKRRLHGLRCIRFAVETIPFGIAKLVGDRQRESIIRERAGERQNNTGGGGLAHDNRIGNHLYGHNWHDASCIAHKRVQRWVRREGEIERGRIADIRARRLIANADRQRTSRDRRPNRREHVGCVGLVAHRNTNHLRAVELVFGFSGPDVDPGQPVAVAIAHAHKGQTTLIELGDIADSGKVGGIARIDRGAAGAGQVGARRPAILCQVEQHRIRHQGLIARLVERRGGVS